MSTLKKLSLKTSGVACTLASTVALRGSKSLSGSSSSQKVTGPFASEGKVGPNAAEICVMTLRPGWASK